MKKIAPVFFSLCMLFTVTASAKLQLHSKSKSQYIYLNFASDLHLGYGNSTIVSNGLTAKGNAFYASYAMGASFQYGYEQSRHMVSAMLQISEYYGKYNDAITKAQNKLVANYVSLPITYTHAIIGDGHNVGFFYAGTIMPQYYLNGQVGKDGNDASKTYFSPLVVTVEASAGISIMSRKPMHLKSYHRSGGTGYFTDFGTIDKPRCGMIGPFVAYTVNNMTGSAPTPGITTNVLVFGLRWMGCFVSTN